MEDTKSIRDKDSKLEDKLYTFIFLGVLSLLPLILLIKGPKVLDLDERRYLKTDINISRENIISGKAYDELEDYLLDQFPFRSTFRHFKSLANYNLFLKKEYGSIILEGNYAIKLDFDFSYENVEKTSKKIDSLINSLFKTNKKYFVLVPDKSCFYGNVYYDKCMDIVMKNVRAKLISIDIDLEDYYKYDSHWNQKEIVEIAGNIMKNMGKTLDSEFIEREVLDFKGIYSSNAAMKKSETLTYLTNKEIEEATVYNFETNKFSEVYDFEKMNSEKSLDKYDLFLSGATPLLKITNPSKSDGSTLIIFRDSYGSSISPLFINCYENIYLIDLRYMASSYIKEYIDITGEEDILFLYSTTIMEMPDNFKIL